MPKNIAIECSSVSKNFKEIEALKNINLRIYEGEIFGIIGPDGAGKTTLFRILNTLLKPNSGNVSLFGLDTIKDYKVIRTIIGYMPGKFSLYPDLSVEENLTIFASVFNTTIEENYDLIKDIYSQIEPFKTRKAGKLSGGMKQKLALSCALIHKPRILFLDEPTTGVDPVSRKEFWEMLQRLRRQGITIIVSTPYMDEASLCDRIALIQHGNILTIDSVEGIIKQFSMNIYCIKAQHMSKLFFDLKKCSLLKSCYAFGDSHHVILNENIAIDELKKFLDTLNHEQLNIEEGIASIEDCFMQLSETNE